jgi:hypothetical protein
MLNRDLPLDDRSTADQPARDDQRSASKKTFFPPRSGAPNGYEETFGVAHLLPRAQRRARKLANDNRSNFARIPPFAIQETASNSLKNYFLSTREVNL